MTHISENAINILTALTFKNIGNAWAFNNLKHLKHSVEICELLEKKVNEPVNEHIFRQRYNDICQQIENLGMNYDGVTALGDSDFPIVRGNVKDSNQPIVIFYKGNLELLSKHHTNLAVIGVLTPDKQIEQDERQMVDSFVHDGANIVSGLALGCDGIAHHQALLSGGKTIAILPSPLNQILPKQHIQLANEIVEQGGLVISEYYKPALDFRTQSKYYIERDRLQALFSDCTVLAASYSPDSKDPNNSKIDSGARHALAKAKEYNLPRAVMYHEKYTSHPMFDLNRQIIKEDSPNAIIISPEQPSSFHNWLKQSLKQETAILKSSEQANLGF